MAKQQTTSNELAKKEKEETNLSVDLLFNSSYTGHENITADCLKIPFIKVAQSLSAETTEESAAYIKGLKPGYFFNTVSKKNYGKVIRVIPIGQVHMYIEWDEAKKGLIKAKYSELEYKRLPNSEKERKDKEGKLAIKETFNLFALNADSPLDGISIMPFAGSKRKHFKNFLSESVSIRSPKNPKNIAPMFTGIYTITTAFEENDYGKFYNVGKDNTSLIKFEKFIDDELAHYVRKAIPIVEDAIKDAKNIDFSESDKDDGAEEEATEKGDDIF
jgi:hypothetical protein